MSNTPYSRKPTHRKDISQRNVNPLPVPVTTTSVPAILNESAQLDTDLHQLTSALLGEDWLNFPYRFPSYSEADVACVKRWLPVIDKLRAQWATVNRPASADQIATEILALVTALPTAGNIDPDLRAQTLCADIAELRPSVFVLARACRAVRGKCEFLSQEKLEKEIRRVKHIAAHYTKTLKEDLTEYLERAEQEEKEMDIEELLIEDEEDDQ